jgi:hypothetical protein
MPQQKMAGNIFIFHAFDIGDEIALDRIKSTEEATSQQLSKYFKNYHIPLTLEIPNSPLCASAKIHNFGVITLRYQIPFNETLEDLRTKINEIEQTYNEQSVVDAGTLFERIKHAVKQPRFFLLRTSYVIIHVQPTPEITDIINFKKEAGSTIASLLRFETEILSEYQKEEILTSSMGYYRNDLIIIDTDATFMYDEEYEEVLDLFEFANMQSLELQYFDRLLDKKLSIAYERKVQTPPLKAYLPFVGALINDPVGELGQTRVDISVIAERLENSMKLTGEPYYSEMYTLLSEKLDLQNWKDSISRKLSIVQSISNIYQHQMEIIRDDLLSLSIIVLIFLEFLLGLLNLMKH